MSDTPPARRALVVAPQPFFSYRGTPFSVYYRTLVTSELGVQVDLLTYGDGLDVDIPGVRIVRIPRFPAFGPIPVGPSWLKLWLDAFVVLWTLGLLVRRRYDFVHAHEESVFFLRFLKPLFRFRMLYDMHSSLPQQLRNFGFTRSRAIIGTFAALERTCLRQADAVIAVCPALYDYARRQTPDAGRVFLLENSLFEPVRLRASSDVGRTATFPELPADRPIVTYAGTFESYQGVDLLIRAFTDVRRSRPDAILVLVGGTAAQVDTTRASITELGLGPHCVLTGTVPKEAAARILGRAAVIVSPRVSGDNTPLKVYELLASGVPFVATRIHSHTQVLNDDVCFLVDPEPAALARGILRALDDEAAAARVVAAARELYRSRYSRTAYVGTLRRVLERLD